MNEGSWPKAYKDGVQEFFGREFLVSPDVLIPRPETEAMVEMVLSLAGKEYLPGVAVPDSVLPEKPRILDVGTGSGCVAVTLKLELPEAEVSACDISLPALEVAEKNARRLKAEVEFMKSDLLSAVGKCDKFDVIVANLPYVDRSWPWISGVECEPDLALYAEDGGLEIVFRLFKQVQNKTNYLLIEADPCQHERVKEEIKKYKYKIEKINGYQILMRC